MCEGHRCLAIAGTATPRVSCTIKLIPHNAAPAAAAWKWALETRFMAQTVADWGGETMQIYLTEK